MQGKKLKKQNILSIVSEIPEQKKDTNDIEFKNFLKENMGTLIENNIELIKKEFNITDEELEDSETEIMDWLKESEKRFK